MSILSYRKQTADARSSDGSQLWDLETWVCELPEFYSPRPEGVPANADRDYGHRTADGRQVVVFRKITKKA
jgi:hypothetical protein